MVKHRQFVSWNSSVDLSFILLRWQMDTINDFSGTETLFLMWISHVYAGLHHYRICKWANWTMAQYFNPLLRSKHTFQWRSIACRWVSDVRLKWNTCTHAHTCLFLKPLWIIAFRMLKEMGERSKRFGNISNRIEFCHSVCCPFYFLLFSLRQTNTINSENFS